MSEVDKFLDSYEANKGGSLKQGTANKPASEVDALMQTAPAQDKGFLGHAKDLGLSALKSAIAVPEAAVGLADIPTGGAVGKFLENKGGAIGFRPGEAKEFLSEFHTDQYKDQQRQFQEADGVLDKTAVALQNPSLIANTVTESIAPMLAGGVAARGIMGATRLGQMGAKGAAAAGAVGEGLIMAGSQAAGIRQETDDGLLTPTQAGAAVATGALGTLFGFLGGRIAQRFGFGDIDTMLAQGANPSIVAGEMAKIPAKSIPRQVIEGAITEGFLEELPQSISEQIIQNLALNKPWSDGVEDAAVMGTLAGMAMGSGASLYSGVTRPRQSAETPAQEPQGFNQTVERPVIDEAALGRAGVYPPAPAPIINPRNLEAGTPSQQMGLDPAAGPMSAAAALAVDTGASAVATVQADPETGEILQASETPDQMRERLAFIEQQAKNNGGWDRKLIEERDRLQGELAQADQVRDTTKMIEPATSPDEAPEQFDVSARTDAQLQVLAETGKPGWKEAAQAEIARRATPTDELRPDQDGMIRRVFPNKEAAIRAAEGVNDNYSIIPVAEADVNKPWVLAYRKPEEGQGRPANRQGAKNGNVATGTAAGVAESRAQEAGDDVSRGASPAPDAVDGGPGAAVQPAGTAVAGRSAPEPVADQGRGQASVQDLRRQLREVEAKIIAAAPDSMGEGGGDIESAVKSRKVPVTLKAQRKRLKDQLKQVDATFKGEPTSNVPKTEKLAAQATEARGQEGAAAGEGTGIGAAAGVTDAADNEVVRALRHSKEFIARFKDSPAELKKQQRFTAAAEKKFGISKIAGYRGGLTVHVADRNDGNATVYMQGPSGAFLEAGTIPLEQTAVYGPQPTQTPAAQGGQAAPAPAPEQDRKPMPSGLSFPSERIVTNVQGAFEALEVQASSIGTSDGYVNFGSQYPDGRYYIESAGKSIGFANGQWGDITPEGLKPRGTYDPSNLQAETIRVLESEGAKRGKSADPAQTPAAAAPPNEGATTQPATPEFTTLKDRDGNTVTVRTADLNGTAERLPMFTKDGKRKATRIHRDNLDPTGEKRAEGAKEVADNPLFNIITTKDGGAFASEAAAERELRRRGLQETHEVVPASEVSARSSGFVVRRAEAVEQQQPDAAPPAWRTVKSAPFSDQASAVLALMNAAQKPSQSNEVETAVRALARAAEESGDATARGIATFVADNALEALASHKINAGRGSVVEKARHKKLKDGIERLRSLEVERVTRGDETPATASSQATHKDPGQPAEPAQQQERAADTQAAAERTEYPFGEVPTNQESKFFRSRVRVLPEMRGDTAWDGEVGSILNGGRLLEVTRDGRDFSVRVRGERIEVLERVENGIKESEVKFDASVNDRWSSIVAATNEESVAQRSVQALARFAGATGEPVNDVWGRWRDFIGATELAGRTGEQVVRWMESNLISKPWDDRAIPGNDVNGSMGSTPDYWRSKLADYERAMTAFNEADARMDQQTFDVERVDGSPERTKAAREILSGMRKKAAENGEYIRKKVQEAEKNEAEETARAEEDRLSRFKPFDAGLASKKPSVASITGWFAGTWSNGANTAWSDGSIADLYGEPHLKGWETRKDNKRTTPDVDRVIPRNSNDPLEPVGMYDGKVGQTKGVMYYQMGDNVLPFALHYVQYFMSKYKGAKLVGNLNTPAGPAAVVHEGRTVGVIMPMRVNQVTAEELRENIAKGEKITQQREKAEPAAQERTEQPVYRLTFDQWLEQQWAGNRYRDAYLENANGDERKAKYAAASGGGESEVSARGAYWAALMDAPRDADVSLEMYDGLNDAQKRDASRHFFKMDDLVRDRYQREAMEKRAQEDGMEREVIAPMQAEVDRLRSMNERTKSGTDAWSKRATDAAKIEGLIADLRAGRITPAELPAKWRGGQEAEQPAAEAPTAPQAEEVAVREQAQQPSAKIADFGEKIGGAKKDVWSGFKEKMGDVSDADIASEPLSKVWPQPDYQGLIDSGVDPWVAAFIRAARDEIPSKPRQSWKVSRWAEQVKTLRALAQSVMSDSGAKENARELFEKNEALAPVRGRVDLYMAVGHGKSLEGVRFQRNNYTFYKGQNNVSLWVVEQDAKATAWSNWPRELATGDTKEQALAEFKRKYDSLNINEPAARQVSFDIYSKTGTPGYFIGKKIGRNYFDLAGPFGTVKEARDHKENERASLLAKLEKVKEIPSERRDTNEPRVGVDMRNAQDVTPQMFAETFGFRGVEFGNYVEQRRRQKDLNDAFDALMDMAAVLGVPPKAISLNGELGLAFGARGSGGKGAPAAHYESGRVVINLTKREGAGSLGHEWWHALDNYFSRVRGKAGAMTTEAPDVALADKGSNFLGQTVVRREMIQAFGEVMRAIRQTALQARSSKLDSRKTKEYWTTKPEMSARAFESYLISKLQDQGASNDYLANIVDEATWKAAESMGFELDGSYPYPTAGEVPKIRAAFDNFFAVIQTKETDKGIALFSRNASQAYPGITEKGLVRAMRVQFKGLADITQTLLERGKEGKRGGVVVIDSSDNAEIARIVASKTGRNPDSTMRTFSEAGRINGFYDPKTGLTFLVGPNLNPVTATAVLFHEMMHGQQRKKIDARALELVEGRNSLKDPSLRAFLDRVMTRMESAGEVGNASEASAYIVEQAVLEGRSAGYTFADSAFMQWVDKTLGKPVGDFLRSFVGMFRTWMLRNGLGAKTMTVDDLVGYAMAGLERAAQGDVRMRAGAKTASSASVSAMSDRNRVASEQAPDPAGDGMTGGATPQYTARDWREWSELPRFQSDDDSTVLFNHGHGGYIQNVDDRRNGVFDGIFALLEPGMTERGPDVTAFRIPNDKMLSQRDLSYALDYDAVSAALVDVFPKKLEVGGQDFDEVWKVVVEDRNQHEAIGVEEDGSIRDGSYMDIMGYSADDFADASWEAQNLRGRLASKLGYQAIEMDDENGTSWYIVPGVKSIPLNEPTAPDGPGVQFSRAAGDAPAQEAQRVQSAIEGKTLIEAAQFMTHSKNGAKAAVAQKVLEKLQRLEKAGVALDLKIVHRGDMVPAGMVNARGYTETGFDDKGRDIVLWLNGADVTGKVGTEEEVLLHELVHAATAGMVFYGTQTPNSLAGKHTRDLMAVTDAIAEHIRKRFDATDAGKATLTEFEQDMREGANNAFRNDDEVLAWALSSSEAQAYLETIPYRAGSMWSNFVQAVRNLLGLSKQNDTALSEVLRVAERIMTDDAPAAGRAAFWHKRNIRMAQQQARGSIAQTAERGDDLQFSRASQTASKAFRDWFGDSKVVDENGQPLVVYHGTTADVEGAMRAGGEAWSDGIFFTDSAQIASSVYAGGSAAPNTDGVRAALGRMSDDQLEAFAERLRDRAGWGDFWLEIDEPGRRPPYADQIAEHAESTFDDYESGTQAIDSLAAELGIAGRAPAAGSNVIPSYLSLQNPLDVDGSGMDFDPEQQAEWIAQAKADGHDGLVIRNYSDGGFGIGNDFRSAGRHDVYVAFRPEQIKSAVGNAGTFDPGTDDIRFSREGMQQAAKNIGNGLKSLSVQDVKKAGKHTLTDWLKVGLQFLGRRQLVDLYGEVLPLDDYDRLAAQMEADKNDVGAEADDLARRWGKLKDEDKLADLMHDATLAQIDADDTVEYAPGDDQLKSRMLKEQFKRLTPDAQQVYREARDNYRKHHDEVRQAIKDRIMRSELREGRKAELLKRMDDDFFKAVKGVYFPLARFGQYVVVTKNAQGEVESVSRAETMAEAEALRAEMVKAFPAKDGYKVGRVILSKEFVAGRDMVGRGFMTELFEALDQQGLDPRVQAELEDTLGQLYLSSLPDLSWAKHGIHRKGTAGFSNDARRAFAQNTFHGARYLAKLKYGDQMQTELDRMQKHVDEMAPVEGFDQPKAQRVVDEMNKRHDAMMNPQSNPISTALTSFGFVYYLGISPAAAAVNLSQTPLVAFPVLGAKWGFRKASAALMKASKETMEGKNDIRSRLKNPDELKAYDEAVRTGVIDVTMAHDLAGIAQGEDAKVMWKIRPVMRAASYLFHHAERFNRQATFLAAYRLARDTGAKHDTAYAQAVKATYDGHFDYSAGNRARVMQGNVAKVVLLFKQYAQNMIYTISRNAYQSVKGETPEVRKEARKVFAALMTMHAAAAGVLGLPMVSTMLALASALGGSDDEPWDAEIALRNMMADAFGPKASEVIAKGFSRLTPWDISGRVGLDHLLFPDVNESLEGQRWAESFATAMLGPVAGMLLLNPAKGAQKMADGDYMRGLEDMTPIAVRNMFKALRQYRDGEVDRTGIVIKDEVSLAGVLGQASGFSPSEIRLAFEGRSAIMSADRRLASRRQDLLAQFAKAAMDSDTEGMSEAREAIAEFNKVNPGRRITPPQLWQSVRNRQRRIREAEDGVYLPRTRRDVREEGRFADLG